jgi:hypothetical protein
MVGESPGHVYRTGYNRTSRAAELLEYLRQEARGRGTVGSILYLGRYTTCRVAYPLVHRDRFFSVSGERFPYLRGSTYSERAVEVPWVEGRLRQLAVPSENVLEVGNVMGRHGALSSHVVVDKYELGPGILNQDVLDFRPDHRFPVVVSISTLEHVGFDESPREPGKVLRVLRHLHRTCLADGGTMMTTVPFGYNPEVDELLLSRSTELGAVSWLQRVSSLNLWSEVGHEYVAAHRVPLAFTPGRTNPQVVAFCRYTAPSDHR